MKRPTLVEVVSWLLFWLAVGWVVPSQSWPFAVKVAAITVVAAAHVAVTIHETERRKAECA